MLVLKLHLDAVKMHLCTKMKLQAEVGQKFQVTDRQTQLTILPIRVPRLVINCVINFRKFCTISQFFYFIGTWASRRFHSNYSSNGNLGSEGWDAIHDSLWAQGEWREFIANDSTWLFRFIYTGTSPREGQENVKKLFKWVVITARLHAVLMGHVICGAIWAICLHCYITL